MSTWTKSTVVRYVERANTGGDYTAIRNEVEALVSAVKTDGTFLVATGAGKTTENIVIRSWVDEAAAQSWINFLNALTDLPDGPIESTSIVDLIVDGSTLNNT